MKYVIDFALVFGTLLSLWVLNFQKVAIEGCISGLVLGVYIGWRVCNDHK